MPPSHRLSRPRDHTTVCSGPTIRGTGSLYPQHAGDAGTYLLSRTLLLGPTEPTTSKEVEGIRMTHDIHTMNTLVTEPATTGTSAEEAADRELFAARAELASLGAAASPSRLERALERLEAAQRASQQSLSQAA